MSTDAKTTTVSPKISDSLAEQTRPFVSLEFFPPKTKEGLVTLFKVMKELKAYNPLFADVTWGAGGSTSDLTLEICQRAKDEAGLNPNMHLTCTNMEEIKIDIALEGCRTAGITNILALRGDPPAGQEAWVATEGGFTCALDLVRHIRAKYTDDFFCVSVAGYPEGHPTKMTHIEGGINSLSDSERGRYSEDVDENGNKVILVCKDEDYESELAYLKAKIDAGANAIVTQMFFDVEVFRKFVEDCRRVGINVPIIPGIMLISTYAGFKRMTKFCKTRVPEALAAKLESLKDHEDEFKKYGIEFGIEMCRELLAIGAPGLHFYTLNTSKITKAILDALQLEGHTRVHEETAHVFEAVQQHA